MTTTTTGSIVNRTTATPAEIDTRLARLYFEIWVAENDIEAAQKTIDRIDEASDSERKYYSWLSPEKRAEAYKAQCVAVGKREVASAEAVGLEAEFTRRGGWTRFYLVTNGNGHVHWTKACGTCFPTTQFAWLTEQSGMTHEALVEMAGEQACTVCFPDAPVDVLNRKGSLEAPERKAAREEREAKRAAKDAAQVTVEVHCTTFRDKTVALRPVTWKTVRALQNDLGAFVREYTGTYAMVSGFRLDLRDWVDNVRVPVNREEGLYNIRVMVAALKERGVDGDAVVAKNHKRAVKEGGTTWDGVL